MDTALDSDGGLIRAEDAPRYDRYRCPECKVRVRLSRGTQRVAHFKHHPGSETDQSLCDHCPLYISAQGGSPQATVPKPLVRPPAKALLAVGWKRSADAPERWSLYVSVPLPPLGVEQVLVEGNINGEIWLNRRVIEKQRHIPVKIAAKQYSCRHRPMVTTAGGFYSVQPTDLLELNRANVFAAGTSGGAQLAGAEPLVRGRCYFSLSSKQPDVWRPPPRNTSRAVPGSRDCDPQGAWQGHLFYVPMSPDRQFDAWCQSVCKRTVVAPPDDFKLLFPPLLNTRPDGTLVVPYGETLIFALSGEWDQPEIEVWRDDVNSCPTVEQLSVFDGEQVSIVNLPEGLFSIYATEARRVHVRVEVAVPNEPTIPAFSICTKDLSTGEELQGDLHHQDGAARWSGLMSGSECWGWIDFPQGWPVRFYYRLRNEKQNRSQTVSTSTELAGLIADCLAADPLAAGVDAGIFGKVHWEAPRLAQLSQPLRRDIPHRLRQRIAWLLAKSAVQSVTPAILMGVSPPRGWDARIAHQDIPAVEKFLNTTLWPVSLVPHARSVAKELLDNLKT